MRQQQEGRPQPASRAIDPQYVQVSADGKGLQLGCRPFTVAGFNAYELCELAQVVPSNKYKTLGMQTGLEHIEAALAQ